VSSDVLKDVREEAVELPSVPGSADFIERRRVADDDGATRPRENLGMQGDRLREREIDAHAIGRHLFLWVSPAALDGENIIEHSETMRCRTINPEHLVYQSVVERYITAQPRNQRLRGQSNGSQRTLQIMANSQKQFALIVETVDGGCHRNIRAMACLCAPAPI
jgi:hypothetical protein